MISEAGSGPGSGPGSTGPSVEEATLRQQLLVAHLTNATGTSAQHAVELLRAARGDLEGALSLFFQDPAFSGLPHGLPASPDPTPTPALYAPHPPRPHPMEPPCNTPATPPSFPEALLGMAKLGASDFFADACLASPFAGPSVLLPSNSQLPQPQPLAANAAKDSGALSENEEPMAVQPIFPHAARPQPPLFPMPDGSSFH